jgi:predicted nucleotidyltransferase
MTPQEQAAQTAGECCRKLGAVLGENLTACVLYGSAVRGDMDESRSDINLLIVLGLSSPEAHRVIAQQLADFANVSPFVLSRWELPRSRRTFALKFASIRRNYKVLCGDDPLSDFDPSPELLWFLCEQSLRNLRLRLEHAYIRHVGEPVTYGQAVARNATSLLVALSEVARCAGVEVPRDRRKRPEIIGRVLEADASVLDDARALHGRSDRLTAEQAFELHSRLFGLLSAALDKVRERCPQITGTP